MYMSVWEFFCLLQNSWSFQGSGFSLSSQRVMQALSSRNSNCSFWQVDESLFPETWFFVFSIFSSCLEVNYRFIHPLGPLSSFTGPAAKDGQLKGPYDSSSEGFWIHWCSNVAATESWESCFAHFVAANEWKDRREGSGGVVQIGLRSTIRRLGQQKTLRPSWQPQGTLLFQLYNFKSAYFKSPNSIYFSFYVFNWW